MYTLYLSHLVFLELFIQCGVTVVLSAQSTFVREFSFLAFLVLCVLASYGLHCLFVLSAPVMFALLLSCKERSIGRVLAFLSPYSFTLFLSHSLSAQAFMFVTVQLFNWRVNETSPAWEIAVFMLFYCGFVVAAAIVTLNAWRWLTSLRTRTATAVA